MADTNDHGPRIRRHPPDQAGSGGTRGSAGRGSWPSTRRPTSRATVPCCGARAALGAGNAKLRSELGKARTVTEVRRRPSARLDRLPTVSDETDG